MKELKGHIYHKRRKWQCRKCGRVSILNLSVRAVSSMRNNGQYHGINAVIKLANQMKCDPDDLYLP